MQKKFEYFPSSIYLDREERNCFIGQQFASELQGSILNIGGGGKKHLTKWLPPDATYTEVDISGQPDVILNLEKDLPMPFANQSFDAVVCTDVLEHVDNLHALFEETCRLSSKYIIISLPNAWASFKWDFLRGTGFNGKFYGLPETPPEDRHKWFFSFTDAECFLAEKSIQYRFKPIRWLAIGYVHTNLIQKIMRAIVFTLLGKRARLNLFASTIWVLLERMPIESMRKR